MQNYVYKLFSAYIFLRRIKMAEYTHLVSEGYIVYLTIPNIKDKNFNEIKSSLKLSKSTSKYNVYTFKINDMLQEINNIIKDVDYVHSIRIYQVLVKDNVCIGVIFLNGYFKDLVEYTFYKKHIPINFEEDNPFKDLLEYTKINVVRYYKDRESKHKIKTYKRKQFEEFLSYIEDKELANQLKNKMEGSSYRYVTFYKQYKDNYYLVIHNSYFEDEGCRTKELDNIVFNHKPLVKTNYYSLYKPTNNIMKDLIMLTTNHYQTQEDTDDSQSINTLLLL